MEPIDNKHGFERVLPAPAEVLKKLNLDEGTKKTLQLLANKILKEAEHPSEFPSTIKGTKNVQSNEKIKAFSEALGGAKEIKGEDLDISTEHLVEFIQLFQALFQEDKKLETYLKDLYGIVQRFNLAKAQGKTEGIEDCYSEMASVIREAVTPLKVIDPKAEVEINRSRDIVQFFEGLRKEALFEKAAMTHVKMIELKEKIDIERAGHGRTGELDRDVRKELFKNVKVLKENIQDLSDIQKLRKENLVSRALHRGEVKQIHEKVEELRTAIDAYEASFNFNPDEVKEFQAYSIEAHRPIRQHLVNFGMDFLDGARNLANKATEGRAKEEFLAKIASFEAQIATHPKIGAGKLSEPLSSDKNQWKREQAEAKDALQEVYDELKEAYVVFSKGIGKDIKIADAAKELETARNAVMIRDTRWKDPIKRDLELPDGVRIKHTMTPTNSGYASSSYRGRKANENTIQSNSFKVDIKGEDLEATYFTSATPVEFYQKNDQERHLATKQQCLENLLHGAFQRVSEDGVKGTKENPVQISYNAVGLLSPDRFRDFFFEHPKLNTALAKALTTKDKFLGGHSQKIDDSQVERRMLKETFKAFQELQKGEITNPIKIKLNEGDVVEVSYDDKAKCYEIKRGKVTLYATFDIALFDFGVNKIKAKMLSTFGGNAFENALNKAAWQKMQARAVGKIHELTQERKDLGGKPDSLAPLEKAVEKTRDDFKAAERVYREAPSVSRAKEKRDLALKEWSSAKDALASELAKLKIEGKHDKYIQLTSSLFDIQSLKEEIEDQFEFKDYLTPEFMKVNSYSMSSAVVTLGALLHDPTWTGCRSGKDRTSLQRVEIATRFGMREVNGRFRHFLEMEKDERTYKVREHTLLNSGQIDELAKRNIGSQGLNLSGGYGSYLKKFVGEGKPLKASYEEIITGGAAKTFAMRLK